ncbi:gliding motility-associated-like protein [Catalinimonas alkaloidigena]|uniref:FG-GAP-like repeat-containing protein n=1 Tax=Catalinimonas alkaloidigena TaxID=1075417 RepID=UPI0024063A47|nr:FG-GAP-like repeat-containing protein [Catalinimonas alkaloidigena]MDF9801199.1 gliding motility-associated-like protein [Catalinimonas alkaloidigena]
MQSYRYLLAFVLILTVLQHVHAQAPVINNIDRTYGTVEEIVTISGQNFGADQNNILVMFGAAAGEIVSLTDGTIKVKVPAGATYGSISVTRLDTQLTAYSTQNFTLSFDGQGFENSQLEAPISFPSSGNDLANLCMCDFNLDGKVDIATSDLKNDEITILENTSPDISSVNFTQREFELGADTRWVRCGDLDGDGFADLVFSASNSNTNKERIYIHKNITDTTVSDEIKFNETTPPLSYTVDGNSSARMDIKDLDGDGKPEIIVTTITVDGVISIFRNTSSEGDISFNPTPILPFQQFNINNEKISGIDIEDLDGDGKFDIMVSEDEGSGIYIIKNSSSPGNISFSEHLELSTSGLTTNMRAGDLNGDGKPEIIIINKSYVGIFKNTSTAQSLSFTDALRIDQISIGRDGLELADMDGNGKLDILYASASGNRLVVLLNQSTESSLDFNTKKTILSSEGIQSVRAGDLNGDGKPDLAYAEIASDVITVQLNRNCVKPILEPQNGLGVCDLLPYELSVTKAIGVTYQWESSADGNSFTPLAAATDSIFTFTTLNEAYYRVKLSSSHNGFDCNEIVSNVVQVVRPEGFVPDKPTIIDINPEEAFCFGDRIILRAQNVNARFFWTGPNGFTSNEQNPVINNASKDNEGWYVLYVKAGEQDGGCVSDTTKTYIKVSEPESISITSDDPLVLFEDGQATLNVEAVLGSTYSWKKDGQLISGATTTTLNVTEPGSYTATIQNETGCTKESSPIEIARAQIDIPASVCLNQTLDVSVSPTTINGQDISYQWSFGDESNNQNEASVSHSFAEAGTYTVSLKIIADNNSVKDTYTQEVTIIDIPELYIETLGSPNLCPDEQLEIAANEGFASYAWDNGESGTNITVNEAGIYTLTALTDAHCTETASIEIVQADNPEANINASSDRISLGDTLQLNASGGASYIWSPGTSLSDSTIANPIARPLISTTYTCIVTNTEGCQTTVSYTLNVDRSLDVAPDKAFTPNNDGRHDTWYVERMDLFPDCKLTIFDRLGSKLAEIENYNNASGWDGTIHGRAVADGVYFYLIDCGEEAGSKTGSVTIIR